ncbi:hypothetical protein HYS49_02110 [Candidatus Woesearchaeota archaeon]|nr:hypothetical protein [Candidatus Woesearchaeota archaeon]
MKPLEKLVGVPLSRIPRYVGGYSLGQVHYRDDDGVHQVTKLHPTLLVYLAEMKHSPATPKTEKEVRWMKQLYDLDLVYLVRGNEYWITRRSKEAQYDLFPFEIG